MSSRFTLPAVVAVFFLPFVVGSALFWSGWRPDALRNHGDLIQPPRSLPAGAVPLGKWLLIVPAANGCTPSCLEAIRQLQQVHSALGKDQGRVQRIVIGGAPTPAAPGMTTIPLNDEVAWRRALDGFASAVFVADPLGNVMMRYSEPINARDVLRDMERLLKYSWVR